MPLLPGFYGNSAAAVDLVHNAWPFFEDKALTYANKTLTLVDEMTAAAIGVAPSNFSIAFPDVGSLTAFTAPPVPVLAELTFNEVNIPEPPVLDLPARPVLEAAPVYDVPAAGTLALPTQPGDFNIADPGNPPDLMTVTLPDAPDMTLPPLPTFLTIVEQAEPVLVDIAFEGHDPGNVPALPDLTGTSFTEQPYTREVLDAVVIKVRDMLAGHGGLPAAIEFALFERGRDQISREDAKARDDILDSFSSRGFSLPPGSLIQRLDDATGKTFDAASELARTQAIDMAKERLTDVRTAVQQGIALETILIGQHSDIMNRALQSAKQMLDVHTALFNAAVAAYNASIARLQVDAEVFKSRIEAQSQQVELFKAKWQGQQVKSEVNKALADLYDSRVKALLSQSEIYKSQVEAVQVQAQIEASRITAYSAKVNGYAERVRAYEAQWNGFTAAVGAQTAKLRNFEIGVNAYGARVNAWSTQEKTKGDLYKNDLEASTITLEQYKTRIAGALASINAESARIDALARNNTSLASMYTARGSIEEARTNANTRAFTAALDLADKETQLQLESARTRIQEAQNLLQVQVTAVEGALRAMTQLTASVFSGVNFSAGVNASGSETSSYGYNLSQSQGFNWSGETAVNNSPPVY